MHDVFPVRCGFAKRKHDSLSYDCDYCADHRSVAGGGKGVFYCDFTMVGGVGVVLRGRPNCDSRRAQIRRLLSKLLITKRVDNNKDLDMNHLSDLDGPRLQY
ncbi:unnamed protein product [Macrosiphum euphorbiae]|uniref:Uncharacterized protein n=1 Tax=Macrosiphum euphorbiae TaxID=13131 RepID=A0AAV0VNU0_9HEMI|nr:unnamed protein product [Macrosiphum euphorbiae]